MTELIPRRLRECISGIGCNLSFEEIEELYERHSNVIDSLPDELLLELLENMDYKSAGRFCSSSPRIEGICRDYNVESWFKVEENGKTYLVKESMNDPNREKILHSWNDAPALIDSKGIRYWYKEGKIHRDSDKPAVIDAEGNRWWYKEDKRHRNNDKPATIFVSGTRMWFKENKLHRDGNKPAIIWSDGRKEWYKNDKQYFPE